MNLLWKTSILFLILILSNKMVQNKEVIAIYGFTSHVDEDGTPSRNDKRYIEYNLYLYDDYSFVHSFQKGRLSPKYEKMTGIWKIEGERLVLSVKERNYTDLMNKEVKESYLKKIEFTSSGYKLQEIFGDRQWERRQGLASNVLFDKY